MRHAGWGDLRFLALLVVAFVLGVLGTVASAPLLHS
jgi:hypothetical protein